MKNTQNKSRDIWSRIFCFLFLILALVLQTSHAQTEPANSPIVEEHIRQLVQELPPESLLRRNLQQGARGNGVHYSWMDSMRKLGIKRAVVGIDILFDSKGRSKKLDLHGVEYFEQYENGTSISDSARLEAIRTSGLEKELIARGLEKAKNGIWLDVPRPKPRPFVGGTQVEFLNDEWLPAPTFPMYYARNNDKN